MFDPKSIKAVAVDCDGTLINSQEQLTPRTREALDAVRATGRYVYMATGRSVEASLKFAHAAGMDRYMVNYNGAVLWNIKTESIEREITIDKGVCLGLLDLLEKSSTDFLFYEKGLACYDRSRIFMDVYLKRLEDLNITSKHVSFEGFPFSNVQKSMVFGNDEEVVAIAETLRSHYGDKLNLLVSRPYAHNKVVDLQCTFLEIMSSKTDKSLMLTELAKIEGFTFDNMMVFGDEFNDMRMLQNAGWGVAMGNAPEEVKKAAKDVTLWHDEDGIAVYLEKYLL